MVLSSTSSTLLARKLAYCYLCSVMSFVGHEYSLPKRKKLEIENESLEDEAEAEEDVV